MPQDVLMSVTELPVVAVAYENAGPAATSAAPAIAVQTISRMRNISILPRRHPNARDSPPYADGRQRLAWLVVRLRVGARPGVRQQGALGGRGGGVAQYLRDAGDA